MSLLARIFLSRAQRRLLARGQAVLMYHHIGQCSARPRDPFLWVAPERLDEHVSALWGAGCQPGSLESLRYGPPPPGTFVITLDDGYRDALTHALPVLRRHRITAVLYLVANKLGGINDWDVTKGEIPSPLMDVSEVREWLAAGQQIGSHSLTHANLRKLEPAAAAEEITASRKKLEDLFDVPVRHFAYPFGAYDERITDLVQKAGYITACTVEFGVNVAETPRHALKRIVPLSSAEWLRKAMHRIGQRIARGRGA